MPVRLQSATARLARLNPSLDAFSPNFDGTVDAPASFTATIGANLQADTASFLGNYQAVSDITGTIGSTLDDFSSSFTSSTVLNNQQRVDAVLAGRSPHFSFSYPADPVTTRQVTVNSASEFNAEALVDGTEITIGSSFSGNVRINANDIDVVMDNSLTISGSLEIGPNLGLTRSRIRWTGGNVGCTYIFRCDDVLLDDFYAYASDATRIESEPTNTIGTFGVVRRIAVVNSTFHLDGPSGRIAYWALFTGIGGPNEDHFFGNVRFSTNGNSQNNRFMGTTRLMIVDCVMNPNLLSLQGCRMHEIADVWVRDTWRGGPMLNQVTGSSSPPSVANALFDSFDAYSPLDGFYCTTDASNTGVIQNTSLYYPGAAGFSVFPPYTDGGGNSVVTTWDGTTVPDYSGVGALRP